MPTQASVSSGTVADPAGSPSWAVGEAKKTGERVAVTSEQSEVRDVYANPDGSFTAELRVTPVRVRRGSGWVSVDTTLRQRADGGVEPGATTVPVVFSGGGGQPLVRFGQDGEQIELRWPAPLPKPVLNGDTATYSEVLPGVDMRMTASAQGFSEVLVVKDRAAAANPKLTELAFGVRTEGVKARADGDGDVGVYDEKGKLVFGSGAPMAWDSRPTDARRAVGSLELAKDELVLRPDRKLLADPATRFPVYIDPDFEAGRTGMAMVLSGPSFHDQEYWGGDGEKVAKVGFCGWDFCNNIGIARSYFQFDAAFLIGKGIREAEFNVFEHYSPSCTKTDVAAYGTDPVSAGTNWDNQPYREVGGTQVLLGTQNIAWGYSASCAGAWVGFDAMAAVKKGLGSHNGATAIMLKAGKETDKYGWKKFRWQRTAGETTPVEPTLTVTYNTPPGEPSAQMVENQTCALAPNEPQVNPYVDNDPGHGLRGPRLSVKVSDPDSTEGGQVRAEFEWYARGGARLGGVITEPKASGSAFTAEVPSAHAADGTKLAYRARGTDGVDTGPWGPWCDFTIDRKGPDKAPKVSSPTYLECPLPDYDTCPAGGAIGFTGGFTFDANGVADVAGFEYYLLGFEGTIYAAAASGTANVLITPPQDGPRDLYVRSVDRAGNAGAEYRYRFWVGVGTPPKGHWKLEGYTETKAVDDSPNGHDAPLEASARWRAGRHGDALWLDGVTGYAGTGGGATVETDTSFSVSAWVKPDRLDTAFRTAVSQNGGQISGFVLQYNPATKKWNFTMPADNSAGAERHIAESAAPAVAGRWTHLVGMYDAVAKQVKIFVDGVAGTSAGHTTPWKATGPVQLGRAQTATGPGEYWPGSLDEVRIYDRLLVAGEVHDLASAPAVEELFLPLDEGTGTTAQEMSGNYRLGTLGGSATWTTGRVGTGAVRFNGTTTSAVSTAAPVVRTDAGFTVTAWVRPDAVDGQTRTILSQDAGQGSGFQLRYRGDTRTWSFALPQSESDGPLTTLSVDSDADLEAGEWTHLAGVYDAAARQIRLYVNTVRKGEREATTTVNATGAFQIGRGKQAGAAATPFAGAIDDVHVWTGVRTQQQIRDDKNEGATTRRTNRYGGQLGRFYNLAGHHVVTTGLVPPGSHFEFSLGMPAPTDAPNTQTVYSCRNGEKDYFLGLGCDGHANLGSIGKLYTTPPAGVPTLRVYRCLIPNVGHFVSVDPKCEGQITEDYPLGYTRAYNNLIRHLATGHPYDHASATGMIEANYRAEFILGTLSMTQLPGTTALLMCRNGTDVFTSTDTGCEGETVVRNLGYLWTSPPQAVPGAPGAISAELFRCRASWGDLFDSRDRNCEGQELDRSLGFVITGL
ncbi:LamG-like jellyroll fold domain-containing protein [Nonomuraea guangzhouensis]|uniref:LamG-like jellyroll fold domain-containing protein n=1 Tax=Nonomuraea guangzhouensis TaxID=1291555 RepID=UPI001C5D0BFF|nr:LamG-like jellyroll fold domain-containing protein [Nonomuraea guangzhouensis]